MGFEANNGISTWATVLELLIKAYVDELGKKKKRRDKSKMKEKNDQFGFGPGKMKKRRKKKRKKMHVRK